MLGTHSRAPDFLNWDNARVIDFVSSMAGVLSRHDVIPEKALDDLRLTLGSFQLGKSFHEAPVLLQMIEGENQLLAVMAIRYGENGLAANILRYCLRDQLHALATAARDLANTLIDKAKLKLNEEIPVFHPQHGLEGYSLLGSELAAAAGIVCKLIRDLRSEEDGGHACLSRLFVPQQMEEGSESGSLDAELARALGFNNLDTVGVHQIEEENGALKELHFQIHRCLESLLLKFKAIPGAFSADAWRAALMLLDEGLVTVHMLGRRAFEPNAGLTSHEIIRGKVLHALHELTKVIGTLNGIISSGIVSPATGSSQEARTSHRWARTIAYQLVKAGVSPGKSIAVTGLLRDYLAAQRLTRQNLLDAEIKSLDPVFADHFEVLRPHLATPKDQAARRLDLKKASLKKLEAMQALLMKGFLPALLIGAISAFLGGCGIKKPPVSRIETLRPSIPLRINPAVAAEAVPASGLQPGADGVSRGTATPESATEPPTLPGAQPANGQARPSAAPDQNKQME